MVGPHDGQEIADRENVIKRYLKDKGLLINNKTEDWHSHLWEPHSLVTIEQTAHNQGETQ